NLDIRGVDVRSYRKETGAATPVPFALYDGETLQFADRSFEAVLATNVLHHAGETPDVQCATVDNEAAVREICRVADKKLVILEARMDAVRNRAPRIRPADHPRLPCPLYF